ASLFPNLVCGGAVMRLPVRRIAVLVWIEVSSRLSLDDFVHSANRTIGPFIPRSNDEFRPIRPEDALALMRGTGRQAQLHRISERRADHGVSNAGVSARRVDNDLSRVQLTALESGLNHAQRRPILHRAAGVKPFGLGIELGVRKLGANPSQVQQWRIANAAKQGLASGLRLGD